MVAESVFQDPSVKGSFPCIGPEEGLFGQVLLPVGHEFLYGEGSLDVQEISLADEVPSGDDAQRTPVAGLTLADFPGLSSTLQ